MRIWKRLLGTALCLCLCVELLPVTARAAAALPVTISTSGNTYQYAESGTNRTQLAYGTTKAETPISKAAFETGDGGTRFTLDTGWDRNFKLIYKEIPVKVTVPANTEYAVTFRYSFGGNYHCLSGQNTAAFSAQAMYLGEKGAASDLMFHTAAGGTVKTTRNGSTVTNIYTAKRVGSSAPVETPGTASGERVFTASFKNTDSTAKAVTRYFGVWAACGDSSQEPTSLTLNFTLVPVTVTYTVKLDANGGKVNTASQQVTLGGQYGDLPTPTMAGFTFIGWYTEKTGGTKVGRYDALVSNASHTLYARWSQNHTHEAVPGKGDKTFTDIDNAEYTTDGKLKSRKVYYPADRKLDKPIYLKGEWSTRANCYLCLNGKTITDKTGHTVVGDSGLNTSIYICDCQGGGEIVNPPGRIDYIFSTGDTQLYLYGGTFRGENICLVNTVTEVDGAALYATDTAIKVDKSSSGAITIKSGTVSGGGQQAVFLEGVGRGVSIQGGTIKNTGNGCAIRIGEGKTEVYLAGSPTITGKSCDILLGKGSCVKVGGTLTGTFSVGLSDPALVTPDKPWTIAVGVPKNGDWSDDPFKLGEGDPTGHFVLPDGEAYKDLYLKNGKDANGKPIVQVCRYNHEHTGGTARCTEWGKCTSCGTAYLKPLGHDITKHDGKDPTCTESGWWAYETCSRCDYTTHEVIPASGHKYGDLVASKPATCTATGMRAHYQCADCKKLFDTNKRETTAEALKITLAAHQYGGFTVDKQPTCTENGSKSKYCTVCKKQAEVTVIPATEHTPVIDAAVAPTCTQTGLTEGKHCSVCNTVLVKQTIVEKLPHSWDEGVETKAPTCTEAGVKTFTCSQCHNTKTEPISALGHDWGEWEVKTPATEETEGSKTRTCQRDGNHTETRSIPKLDHTHNMEYHPAVDADCGTGTAGNIEYWVCSGCTRVFSDESGVNEITLDQTVLPFAHDLDTAAWSFDESNHWHACKKCGQQFGSEAHKYADDSDTDCNICNYTRVIHSHVLEQVPAVPATCVSAGNIAYYRCAECGVLFADSAGTQPVTEDAVKLSPLGHTPSGDWSHDESSHWHECQNNCGEKLDLAPHVYGDDSDTDCNICGYRRDIIPPHIHDLKLVPAVPATCVSAGNIEHYRCEECRQMFRDDGGNEPVTEDEVKIPPLGHDWQAATCETPKTCKRAGCSATEGGPLGHDWTTGWMSDAGFHWHECLRENCGEKSGHAAHIPGPEATEAAPQTCTECGYVIAPALEHTHVYDRQSTDARYLKAAAGCTTKAVYFCSCACGEAGTETFEAGTPLGHEWGRYIVTVAATQESEGVETRTCQRNDAHKQTRPIPKLPASTYGVSGEVHESGDSPAVGVKVTLVLGDRLIDSTKTDDKGKYSFGNMAPGVYNLVAERDGIIMTIKVEVVSKDVAVSTIIMPQGKTNSVVEVKSDKLEETVEAVVGNLETVFKTTGDDKPFTDKDQNVVNSGGSVEIKLTVTKTDTKETSDKIEQELPADTKVGIRLKLDVHKTVTPHNAAPTVTQIENTDVLLETIIRLPAELQGKDSYTVYRLHGTNVHALTASPNANGEYIEVSLDKTAITIHAKLYSEYVIAYQERSETGGNGGNTGGTGGNTGNDNGGGHGDRDDGYTPPSVPARPETNIGYRTCRRDDACPIWPFADAAPTAWYHDGVHYCLENGLMQGVSTAKFLPNGSTTRAQLAAILWRLEGSPETTGAVRFNDTAGGAWYTEAVRWAAGCGVVKGYDNGCFGPNDAVTREQMAAILYRYAQHKGYDVSAGEDTNILSFDDAFAVSEYAIPAMQWACGSGMVHGIARDGGMLLAPRDTTTRAQAATLIMRFQSAFAKEP